MAGIYIHIPFCKQACNYCNFYFTTSPRLREAFVQALLREIEYRKDFLEGEKVETIYFGGGTPTHLPVNDLLAITESIFKHFSCSISEFTIEANPDDLTADKLKNIAQLKQLGLNRFSIGVQSFFDADLHYMHRAHSAAEAKDAIKRTQDAGFELITLDLIYGTPTLGHAEWAKNLETVAALQVPHFSSYALTVEENTSLFQKIKKKRLLPVDEEKAAVQFDMLMQFAAQNNFEHYEISNFAKPGKQAIHNSNYWKGKHYIGFGPSAHSFKRYERSWNAANLKTYIEQLAKGELNLEFEQLSPIQHANELVMTALRTSQGLDLNCETIAPYKAFILAQLEQVNSAFFCFEEDTIKLTQSGKHFADSVALGLWIEE
ncbi:MAG: radical SAM family heme chaperone HemW [Chitinophagales bacterium]|nr:radical SAM family heme chaperone HemW [Chitinophagales bacterium]